MLSENSGGNSAIFESLGPYVSARQKIMGPPRAVSTVYVSAGAEIMGTLYRC